MPLPPTAEIWWQLFNLYTALGIIIGAIVIGTMLFFMIKYRYREGTEDPEDIPRPGQLPKERGNAKLIFIFFILVSGVLFTLTFGTMRAMQFVETVPQDDGDPYIIEVVAFQWGWKFIYPNGTESINTVKIPVERVVVFKVTSSDVYHKFGLPDFKTAIDAIPGQTNTIWIKAVEKGSYRIQCYELCGTGHALMIGNIIAVGG
jgi:cytochrome c oxidase subunit 2